MKQRLAILSFSTLLVLAAFGSETLQAAGSGGGHTSHNWVLQNIYAIVDAGPTQHRLDGMLRCTVGQETQPGQRFENHTYQFTWWSYNQYTHSQHEYKTEHRCTSCGRIQVTSHFRPHTCESIYDSQCGDCGYSHTRLCG